MSTKEGYCKICGKKVILKKSRCEQCGSKEVTTYIRTSHCKNCNRMTLFFYDGNCQNFTHLILTVIFHPWLLVWIICMIRNKNLYRCSECGHTKHL